MMKKLLLLALVLAAPTATFASEISVGTFELKGGSQLAFGSQSYKPDGGDKLTVSTFGADLSGLYYVTPSFAIGAELKYEDTTFKQTGFPSESFSAYTIAPKAAFEFPLAPQISGFGEAWVGLMKQDVLGVEIDGWGFGLGAGVKYFFSKSVSGNVGLNYAYSKLEDDASTKITGNGLSIGAGLSVYFGNK